LGREMVSSGKQEEMMICREVSHLWLGCRDLGLSGAAPEMEELEVFKLFREREDRIQSASE